MVNGTLPSFGCLPSFPQAMRSCRSSQGRLILLLFKRNTLGFVLKIALGVAPEYTKQPILIGRTK